MGLSSGVKGSDSWPEKEPSGERQAFERREWKPGTCCVVLPVGQA